MARRKIPEKRAGASALVGRRRPWQTGGVFGLKTNKPRERFYLFPGQGGKNFHRKQRRFLAWSVAVSVVFGLGLATVMWWVSRPHP